MEERGGRGKKLGWGGGVVVFIHVASYYILMQHPWDLAALNACS